MTTDNTALRTHFFYRWTNFHNEPQWIKTTNGNKKLWLRFTRNLTLWHCHESSITKVIGYSTNNMLNASGERRGSNPRLMESQSIALPLGYARQICIQYQSFEPLSSCFWSAYPVFVAILKYVIGPRKNKVYLLAGNVIRTRNVQLGRMALYHWVIPAYSYHITSILIV